MTAEIPAYCLRAYAMLFSKYGTQELFSQSVLDWIVGSSMKKKIFAHLVRSQWIAKKSRTTYACNKPDKIMHSLLDFKVPDIIKETTRPYCFTGLSAVEIWSDYSYVQRSRERSPYFIKVLKKDVNYWKSFFNGKNIPNYMKTGSTIGEYVILIPVTAMKPTQKEGLHVEPLADTVQIARDNELYSYAYEYMRKKYGLAA
ncbi:MAG: hypothetical protein V1725_08120 [archaeon]